MGKLGKISILLFLCLISCQTKDFSYSEIYRKYGDKKLYNVLNKKLGVENIEKNEKLKITVFIDDKSPSNDYYIFFKRENDNKLIRASFVVSCGEKIEWGKSLACLINIENFEEYAYNLDQNTTKQRFYNFLSYDKDYEIIETYNDIEKLIEKHPITKQAENSILVLNNHKPLKDILRNLELNESICWFADYGLIKFNFKYDNGKLTGVDSVFINYIGNEDVIY